MSEFFTPGVLPPVTSDVWGRERSWTLDAYRGAGRYKGLARVWSYGPDELTQLIKDSDLTGRGGAELPTGLRWSLLPPPNGGPRYFVVNADESEPGTCKDIPALVGNPHVLIGGMAICLLAVGRHHGFVYPCGEVVHAYRRLMAVVRQTREVNPIGKAMGPDSDYGIEITMHAGTGAYICGEETVLLDPLEGRRGQSRLKPSSPAAEGLYARLTVINSVETTSSAPGIARNGIEWFYVMGAESAKGHGFFSLSGHVRNPDWYEAPSGITTRTLFGLAGGIRLGHEPEFWAVGGSSVPLFTPEQLGVPLDYSLVREAGSMLATRAVMVFDETVSVACAISHWTDSYQYESCGECTPCREGTYWVRQVIHRLEVGCGRSDDIDLLCEIASSTAGRSLCALGDAAATPVKSGIELFREEFEAGYTTPVRRLFPYEKMTLFSEVFAQ